MILLNKYLSATSIFNIYVALLRHKMLRVPNVACAVIFDRRLGCADESATDDELADKVLFYYPPTTRLSDQVPLVTLLQSINVLIYSLIGYTLVVNKGEHARRVDRIFQ